MEQTDETRLQRLSYPIRAAGAFANGWQLVLLCETPYDEHNPTWFVPPLELTITSGMRVEIEFEGEFWSRQHHPLRYRFNGGPWVQAQSPDACVPLSAAEVNAMLNTLLDTGTSYLFTSMRELVLP